MTQTGNPIELLVSIKANTKDSQADIQRDLDILSTKLKGLNVGLNLGEGNKELEQATRSLKKISATDLSKLVNSLNQAKLATTQSVNGIEKMASSIMKVSSTDFSKLINSVNKVSNSGRVISDGIAIPLAEVEKRMNQTFGHLGSGFQKAMKHGVGTVDEIKKAFAGMDASFKIDAKNLGFDADGKMMRQIKGVTAEYKNLQGQIERVKFENKEFIDDGTKNPKKLWLPMQDVTLVDNTVKQITQSSKAAKEALDKLFYSGKLTTDQFKELSKSAKFEHLDDVSKYNQKLHEFLETTKRATQAQTKQESEEKKLQITRQRTIDQLERMSQAGRLPQAQATGFAEGAKTASSIAEMDRLRQSIALTSQEYGRVTTESVKQATAMNNLNNRIQDLTISQKLSNAEAQKWKGMYSDSTSSAGIKEINRALTVQLNEQTQVNNKIKEQAKLTEQVRKLTNDIIAAQGRNPKAFGNNVEVTQMLATLERINPASRGAAVAIKGVSDGFSRLKSEATTASRESLSVLQSFKIAMEKFPIWMASSTILFGSVRTAREFMSIIVDLDTKLVSLKKVMDDGTDFEAVFDSATRSAQRFGQSISQAMDAYIEFAKQGYLEEDLSLLSEAGLAASNVGDISAQKASEYMTSALVQWKLDAKDAMGIIDSLIK